MWWGSLCESELSPATLGNTLEPSTLGSSAVQITLPKVVEFGSTSTTARKSWLVAGEQVGSEQPSADQTSSTEPLGIVSPVVLWTAAGACVSLLTGVPPSRPPTMGRFDSSWALDAWATSSKARARPARFDGARARPVEGVVTGFIR